ncbi:MAG: glycosyltransferase [Gemmatimonadota bacterium]
MAAPPPVSILLPCRDAARHLPACLDSLRAQTLGDYELLAVDDGSRDRTRALLEERAAADPRIRVFRAADAGLVAALRRATSEARGALLARMDADDEAHPERLARQVALLAERRELAACGTGIRYIPRRRVRGGYRRYEAWLNGLREPEDLLRDLLVECPIAHPTLMIRASALRALGGYRDAGWPDDYDLVLRLHAAGMRAANLPDVLLRWRLGAARHSHVSGAYSPGAFRRCKVHFLRHGLLPPGRPAVVWGAGRVGKAFAREMLAQGLDVRAFVDLDPRKIGQEIHGAPVLDPDGFLSLEDPYVLAAVGTPGARGEIRAALAAMGRTEVADFRAVA